MSMTHQSFTLCLIVENIGEKEKGEEKIGEKRGISSVWLVEKIGKKENSAEKKRGTHENILFLRDRRENGREILILSV